MFKSLTYIAAIALVAFSGAVSTSGLGHFAPGAEWVIYTMGVLFEVGKLIALGLVVRLSWRYAPLRIALLALSIVLMVLNVVGVSGFLSNNFERELTKADAVNHTATATAQADVDLLERQLAGAEKALSEANGQLVAAKGNKVRIEAANANIQAKTKTRDGLIERLGAAKRAMVQTESTKIESNGEVAAIMVLAEVMHVSVRDAATRVFVGIACIPELLAFFLMLAVELGHHSHKAPAITAPVEVIAEVVEEKPATPAAPVKAKLTARQIAARKGWETRRRNQAKRTGPHLAVANS
jgi:hypothetical protein